MLCQATRSEIATVELPSQSPDGPYRLCDAAAHRIQHLSLRPLEWFNLATIHGPFEHLLHDDFYTSAGKACQAKEPVLDADQYPCPTLRDCVFDLRKLLDFAGTRWHLDESVVDAFSAFKPELMSLVRMKFDSTHNPWFQRRWVEIAARAIGHGASTWFSEVLHRFEPNSRLELLFAGRGCLDHRAGLALTLDALAAVPSSELARRCLVLAPYRDASVLDWIETHVHDPLTHHWGDLAASSNFDWPRARKWLRAGRPLSLVALDALVTCTSTRNNSTLLLREIRPRLRAPGTTAEMLSVIEDCAANDGAPRAKKAAQRIREQLS